VKLLILSDIHGNLDALHAIRESYDELWVLGDIVNYGPEPGEALEAVRATASIVVQGNHDHAVGHLMILGGLRVSARSPRQRAVLPPVN
jgi:protein phosphatase